VANRTLADETGYAIYGSQAVSLDPYQPATFSSQAAAMPPASAPPLSFYSSPASPSSSTSPPSLPFVWQTFWNQTPNLWDEEDPG